MSPTIFRVKNYRFFFFSREETRMHVHITCADGEAKFWIEPEISLVENYGLSSRQIAELEIIVRSHVDEISEYWKKHFRS